MPSEGRHSRHSGASTAENAPGLDTTSDYYGPAATCRSMDLAAAAGARATRIDYGPAIQLADEVPRTEATPCDGDRRLRDRRERADASVLST